MPEVGPTHIGIVKQVSGSQVTVALDDDLAGAAPIYRGQLQNVGQVGSIVRLPQGPVDLVGQVTLLSIAELAGTQAPGDVVQTGERWLQVQLLGEIDKSSGKFQRGVGSSPGLDDPVHFATADDLRAAYPPAGDDRLQIGNLATAGEVPVSLDAGRFVLRHGAVVGSTGAGKTTAVATVLQGFARRGWSAANIVVIDPHGEYAKALEADAAVMTVLGAAGDRLQVPYWALPAQDILELFAGSLGGHTTRIRFTELVTRARREFARDAEWLTLEPAAVTADAPIPFDVREIWYQLDWENNETRDIKTDPCTACVECKGSAASLMPARFKPYGQGAAAPFKAPSHGDHGSIPELLRLGLLDPRLGFFQKPQGDVKGSDPLIDVMSSWLGGKRPVSVLDFSGVPARATELAVGVVLDLLFEIAIRTGREAEGIGRPRPVLIVLEEAHHYLGQDAVQMARDSTNRIAREGRKYGIGLLLVTQRPSELPDTALAQCGTIIALRLTNSADQSKVSAALPDGVSGLAQLLPSLRTGEAIVMGESLLIPSRTVVDRSDPLPDADDPSLASWRLPATEPNLAPALAVWRGIYEGEK